MPRTPEQNNLIKGKRKNRLLEVALLVFAKQGYDGVAIDDITAKAKCSHGLFYHYFNTKEEVFAAVANKFIVGNQHVLPLKRAKELGGTEGIKLLVQTAGHFHEFSLNDVLANIVAFSLTNARKLTAVPEGLEVKDYQFVTIFASLVRQGQEEGNVIDGDPKQIALSAYDMLYGYMSRRVMFGETQEHVDVNVLLNALMK